MEELIHSKTPQLINYLGLTEWLGENKSLGNTNIEQLLTKLFFKTEIFMNLMLQQE